MESDANFLPEIMHDFTRFQPVENTAEDVGWLMLRSGTDEVAAEDKQSCWTTMDSCFPIQIWKKWLKN